MSVEYHKINSIVPLKNYRGSRIIAKVKAVDFAQERPVNDFAEAMNGFRHDLTNEQECDKVDE